METSHPLDSNIESELYISPASREFLKETAKWAKFLAILGFIVTGLIACFGVFSTFIFGAMSSLADDSLGVSSAYGSMFSAAYLAMAILYFFPVLYLYRFATNTELALKSDSQENMDISFENLKSHYKFMGVLAIVMLSLYALAFVGMFVFGVAMMNSF